MCLAIAHFPENPQPGEPVFLLGENRDDAAEKSHERNHIANVEAWPEASEGKTWIGIARHGTSHRCVALLNYYPEEKDGGLTGSRGFVVPQMLHMDEPNISRVKNLEHLAPFQTLTYRRELHNLVQEIWDGKDIQRKELKAGIHVFASSSYGVEQERVARAQELIGARTSLAGTEMFEILSTTDPGGLRTTTTPCMQGEWSETIGSHMIDVREDNILFTGFAGSPHDPDSQRAKIAHIIRT